MSVKHTTITRRMRRVITDLIVFLSFATIGRVALPKMRRAGYDDRLASASIETGGTLGVMIPPSILLTLYGLFTEQSIGKLFSAAIIPGLLGLALYPACIAISVGLNPALADNRATSTRVEWVLLRRAWPVAAIFAVVIGGIQLGVFSPTEAAAIGAAGLPQFLIAAVEGRGLPPLGHF